MSEFLQSYGLQPAKFLCPWGSPGKNTGVNCHSFLQGIFLTQEKAELSAPSYTHCRTICQVYCGCKSDCRKHFHLINQFLKGKKKTWFWGWGFPLSCHYNNHHPNPSLHILVTLQHVKLHIEVHIQHVILLLELMLSLGYVFFVNPKFFQP